LSPRLVEPPPLDSWPLSKRTERLTQIQVFLKEKSAEIDEKFAEKKRKLATGDESQRLLHLPVEFQVNQQALNQITLLQRVCHHV
jgi:hypothetical protein